MNRYETFVVRVWIEDDANVNHGEIRHVTSGMGLRFREVREVVKFIERFSGASPATGPRTKQAEG